MSIKILYKYGMRLRGFSIGCQPMDGYIDREDDRAKKYCDILFYNRPLTSEELKAYELDYLGTVKVGNTLKDAMPFILR